MSDDESTVKPWQRPPFEPGNQISVGNRGPMVSGAWSPRVTGPIAQECLRQLLADESVAYLREPRYATQLAAWAAAEARVIALEAWVNEMPIAKAASAPAGRTPPMEMLRKWEAAALTHRDRLGLTPASAARLGRDIAATKVDVAALMAEMHRQEQAGEAGTRVVDAE